MSSENHNHDFSGIKDIFRKSAEAKPKDRPKTKSTPPRTVPPPPRFARNPRRTRELPRQRPGPQDFRIVFNAGPLRSQVDIRRPDSIEFFQAPLEGRHAVGACHASDRQCYRAACFGHCAAPEFVRYFAAG